MEASQLFTEPGGHGLRCVKISRYQNGFGFTLRHFIVYPPELYVNDASESHVQQKRNRRRVVKVTEPVDTIFVKSVVENGPADFGGLCVGDRIVSVNGQTIFGKSYDQVVQLIQKTHETLRLEVSPKQYDTLQLFFEETAYRPETNQRPSSNVTPEPPGKVSPRAGKVSPREKAGFSHRYYHHSPGELYPNERNQFSSNGSSESFFLNPTLNQSSMSSPYPNSSHSNPQIFSHLSRPTPYKSSSVWSNSGVPHQDQRVLTQVPVSNSRHQPQTYYPFNHDLHSLQSFGAAPLWKIKEEPSTGAKSAESILASTESGLGDYGEFYEPSHRSGSMECLTGVGSSGQMPSGSNWSDMGPGYRYSIAADGNSMKLSSQRRESTGSLPSSNVQNSMVVTMSSTNSKIQGPDHHNFGDYSSEMGGSNPYNCSDLHASSGQGYEHKIVDRIRRSCEQKEEFLRRPNQPLAWTPLQSASMAFPKELYAQPQKFEKIPWPPAHIVPTVTSTKPPLQNISSSSQNNRLDGQVKNVNNVSVVSVQYPESNQSPSRTLSPSGVNVNNYESDRSANLRSQVQNTSSTSQYDARSISPSWFEYGPRNRTTIIGSRKLHCDPPPGWKQDLSSLTYQSSVEDALTTSLQNETELGVQTSEGAVQMLLSTSTAPVRIGTESTNWSSGPQRPNYLDFPESVLNNYQSRHRQFSAYPPVINPNLDAVKLRKRELDLDPENERLVRRVSYLKATSSPIDMDRKSGSPTSPTRSCDILGKTTTPVSGGRRRSVANKLSAEFFPKGRIIRLKQYFEDRNQQPSIFKFNVDSPTSEFRGFGSFQTDKSPDTSDVTREGQIHFKIRVGENKKGGYSRPWRYGWAQIRRSGCLYISKDRLSRDSVLITEDSVIIALSLRSGVTVEQAEDYSKRKHVLRVKTSYTSDDVANFSPESSLANANAHQPSHSTAVEILLQSEDANDLMLWLHCLHTQLENNNYCNGSSNSFKGIFFGSEFSLKQKSLLTSFLPSPANPVQSQHQPIEKNVASLNNNVVGINSVAGNNAASPKTKTWKGKVARQWKKVHNIIETGGEPKGASPYNSIPPVGATFGINLENCPPGESNPLVPRVIEYAIDVVEKKGIDMVGLYRIPGNNASVAGLTDRLNKGEDPNPDKDSKWLDVHVVASLIKSFLRRLPDPLLTDDRYQAFILAADEPDPEKRLENMQYLITNLPDHNYETLRVVVMHLKNVAEHGESNRMDARNLAIVFGPTIVRTAEENVTSMVADMKNQCKIVEMLIVHADELFKERRVKSEAVSPLSSEMSSTLCQPNPLPLVSVQVYDSNTSEGASNSVRAPLSPVATIQHEIRTSVLQAAMRKTSQKSRSKPTQNVYGLPNKPLEKTKPVDDAGFIRSYAGLNEETEQRVRNFELETRAMLSREDRSPHSSVNNVGVPGVPANSGKGTEDFRIHRLKELDDELQKAKDDLENDDIYDQLADNPSSIVHHREGGLPMFPVGSGTRNLSSSSISSSNSNSTVPPINSVPLVPKLGPVPFKSPFVPQYLPPKPPLLHSSGSSITGPTSIQSKSSFSSTSSPVSPLRRVSSMDRLLGAGEFEMSGLPIVIPKDIGKTTITERKLGPLPFVQKHFGGSLDSLKDIANGNNIDGIVPSGDGLIQRNGTLGTGGGQIGSQDDFSPRSSEGSDLVTSLSRTLDKKLHKLRRSQENAGNAFSSLSSSNNLDSQDEHEDEESEVFQFQVDQSVETEPKLKTICGEDKMDLSAAKKISDEGSKLSSTSPPVNTNGLVKKRDRRRNSMIERRLDFDNLQNGSINGVPDQNGILTNTGYYRNPSLHRFSGEAEENISNGLGHSLTKDAKTATNKLTRDCRRRHSLSGTEDILNFAFGDKERKYIHDIDDEECKGSRSHSNDADTSAITTSGVLESHV